MLPNVLTVLIYTRRLSGDLNLYKMIIPMDTLAPGLQQGHETANQSHQQTTSLNICMKKMKSYVA